MGSRNPRAPRSSLPSVPPLTINKEICIKKEAPDDEIKEYAETAMNEFLGWYGYDKVDSRDTQGLDLHHFSRRPSAADEDSSDDDSSSPPRKSNHSNCASPPSEGSSTGPGNCISCCWCSKTATHKSFSLKTPNGLKSFCSELCFTQCRRANFKRNKTCDWCRHIRHTVNYVDFQDGENQLQFCSDKCLNQYKMNIFCKETEAHLHLHPHLTEGGAASAGPGGLITPELWLRDCRSPSPPSTSPSPPPPEPPKEPKPSIHDKKKPPKRNRSPIKGSSQTYPPPLLPLNGGIGLLHPNLPPPRPPFLGGFFSPMMAGAPRLPGGMNHPMISPPTPPPVMPPPPRPPPPPTKSFLPPVTVLVPYPFPIPIPIPLPMPIPIPLDMSKFPFTKTNKEGDTKEPESESKVEKSETVEKVKVEPSSSPAMPSSTLSSSSSHSVPRPLRKRRRVTDISKEAEQLPKRKTVPA